MAWDASEAHEILKGECEAALSSWGYEAKEAEHHRG